MPRKPAAAPRTRRKPTPVTAGTAAEAELRRIGALDTADGQALLRVARSLAECDPRDVAALSRELRLALAAVRAQSVATGDAVDDLKAKRERRRRSS